MNYIKRITTEQKKDLLTGELFIPKRKNQKFANSANQIKYNNKKNALSKKKKAEPKPLFDPSKKTVLDYPSLNRIKPYTKSEIGTYVFVGVLLGGIIITTIFLLKKK